MFIHAHLQKMLLLVQGRHMFKLLSLMWQNNKKESNLQNGCILVHNWMTKSTREGRWVMEERTFSIYSQLLQPGSRDMNPGSRGSQVTFFYLFSSASSSCHLATQIQVCSSLSCYNFLETNYWKHPKSVFMVILNSVKLT